MTELWVYLARTPLLWLTVTVACYVLALALARRSGGHPLCHPVLLAGVILIGLLLATGTSYTDYFAGAQFIHFLLGPATVALAVPLAHVVRALRPAALPLTVALVVGACTAVSSTALLGALLGLDEATLRSLLPRSVTTPIAMGVAEQIGGKPSLTAALVVLTGIVGAVIGDDLLRMLHVRDPEARGFAIGLASHGIGTARALQLHAGAGAFAGLAMSLHGVVTALLLPLLLP